MQLEIRAVPNAKAFSVLLADGLVKVHLKAKPEGNRANEELVQGLSAAIGLPVSIVRGLKSRRKTLEISATADEVMARLRSIAKVK